MGLALLLAASAAALSACGDDPEQPPRFPAAVGGRLAALSDRTADAIAEGDECAAQDSLETLAREADASRAEVPAPLRHELDAGVQRLAAEIECTPAPVTVVTTAPEPAETKKPKPKEHCPPGLTEDHGKPGKGGEDKHDEGKHLGQAVIPSGDSGGVGLDGCVPEQAGGGGGHGGGKGGD